MSYRLIWFQHFHKAAGTTVVNLARQNQERFFQCNLNGNPIDHLGYIDIWNTSRVGLREFVDQCEAAGVSFVASEWGAPDFRWLKEDKRVQTVATLREPFARIRSSYEADLIAGQIPRMKLREYIRRPEFTYVQKNYYVHMLATRTPKASSGNDKLADAVENIRAIDVCVKADGEGLGRLCRALNWDQFKILANATPSVKTAVWHAVRRRKPSIAARKIWLEFVYGRSDYRTCPVDFRAMNALDYMLMEECGL